MTELLINDQLARNGLLDGEHTRLTNSSSPDGSSSADDGSSNQNVLVNGKSSPQDASMNHIVPPGPGIKTDKPRPHICGTCSRSFARLEHLKRHERSHTKEKPFQCNECPRAFARRDLLLRHQQKLHQTTTPPSRAKGGGARRDSSSSQKPGKIRKASVSSLANGTTPNNGQSMRPRANTISHVDKEALGVIHRTVSAPNNTGLAIQTSPNPGHFSSFDPVFISAQPLQNVQQHINGGHGLPKLMTNGLNTPDIGNGLRTAPAVSGHMTFEQMLNGAGHTIDPAQLHLHEGMSPASTRSPFSPQGQFPATFAPHPTIMEDEDAYDFTQEYDPPMSFGPGGPLLDPTSAPMQLDSSLDFGTQSLSQLDMDGVAHQVMSNGIKFEHGDPMQGSVPDISISDNAILQQNLQSLYHSPALLPSLSPNSMSSAGPLHHQIIFGSDVTSVSPNSASGSGRQSSVTSMSTDTITDLTRQALLASLSQSTTSIGGRRFSQPTLSTPMSPRDGHVGASIPSTADLQRFVQAYIQYFHPHFPFLHIPTLSFDTTAYTSNVHLVSGNSKHGARPGGIAGGGACLILAMAAIGALYEFDRTTARELFDASKKVLQNCLEECRKAGAAASNHKQGSAETAARNTPLWVVQAMLLNVIYGHNCGDKVAAEIASTHCTALVSLARAAELTKRVSNPYMGDWAHHGSHDLSSGDVTMTDGFDMQDRWNSTGGGATSEETASWHRWILVEERKRTLFAIYHMSSILVSAYNHAPALMNSEIQLDLPCEEEMWTAPTAQMWLAKGGSQICDQLAIPFSTALATLLSASQNQQESRSLPTDQPFGSGMLLTQIPQSNLRVSTFGCLVLIDALHNYIWETRQRHHGRKWTKQETQSMHSHIEPALRAWQAAWASNPSHSLERPNPHGHGPLSADSIPLLDLAYVRLFVNLGKSKEHFWTRDFEAMSEELARGLDIIQHAEHSGENTDATNTAAGSRQSPAQHMLNGDASNGLHGHAHSHSQGHGQTTASKRERHLRKAACYAADSLTMSDKLGVTFADFTSRELPLQSAMCAFDCAQVLAEWAATLQERVGRFLGILGRDQIDYTQMPAVIMLEEEDCKLFDKIVEILRNAEAKMNMSAIPHGTPLASHSLQGLTVGAKEGFSSKILRLMGIMLERAAVWPVTNLMCHGLHIQASYMQKRAEASLQSA